MPGTLQIETLKDTRGLDPLLGGRFAARLEALARDKAEEYKANTPLGPQADPRGIGCYRGFLL
jgi:hypothetical protein